MTACDTIRGHLQSFSTSQNNTPSYYIQIEVIFSKRRLLQDAVYWAAAFVYCILMFYLVKNSVNVAAITNTYLNKLQVAGTKLNLGMTCQGTEFWENIAISAIVFFCNQRRQKLTATSERTHDIQTSKL